MRESVRFILFGIALCFFGFAPGFCHSATLTGAETAKVGELLTIVSEDQGEWLTTPIKGVTLAKDTGGKIVYFLATFEGEYTLIFIGVKDGKPEIAQKPITVKGSVIGPIPTPEPNPEPSPEPYPNPSIKLTSKEKTAAKSAVEAVLDGIEDGSIKSPSGARSTFKQVLSDRGTVCNGYTCALPENLKKLSDEWTKRCKFDSISDVKSSFENFLKEVQ